MKKAFFSFLLISVCWMQGSIKVDVDRRKINEGDTVILTVTALDMLVEPEISLPIMNDFKVVNGPSQSSATNLQYINGRMSKSSTLTYTWTLMPVDLGQAIIPSIKVNSGKESFVSPPISIMVSKRDKNNSSFKQKFFIEAEVNNKNPYRGEQIVLSYILYTQVNVSSFDDELPKFKGLWTEELFTAKNLQLREVKKNNSKYYAATIKKIALFPTKSGKIIIDPLIAIIGIQEKTNRWNNFSLFGPPSKKHTISTNKIELDVQPLPNRDNGKVSAIVGNWEIQSNISNENIIQDEAITFKIEIQGEGNIHTIDMSKIIFSDELEVFEPKISIIDKPLQDKVGGKKIFEWVIIPRMQGDINIKKFDINYFDPKKKLWITKMTSEHRLKVLPNKKSIISPIGLSKEEIAIVGEDIRFIDESKPKWKVRDNRLISATSFILFVLSSIVFVIPYAQNYSRDRLHKSSNGKQQKLALKYAIDIIDSSSQNDKSIYKQIYKALITYINMKINDKKADYSTSEIIDHLKEFGKKKNVVRIEKILNRCELAMFSPVPSQKSDSDRSEIKSLLKQIDNDWV